MLVRVTGASEGIRDYLENGHKQGREYTRDTLDERVVLHGDLDVTDKIINRMTTDADKYLHVTLSFKEDHISRETMDAVVRDFNQFAFSVYGDGEYSMYAEAHLPKIKSYINKKTGEFVERKPHIHIVIPKTNLLSGTYLSPFGRYEHNESFIEAFQEYANHKYGLASPKDNRRIEITSASDVISRYKGDMFGTQGRGLKEQLLNEVLDQKITRYEDFEALARSRGEVRTRPSGYLNLKAEGAAKGINLKEYVFSREFIELDDAEKRRRLTGELAKQYETAGESRRAPAALEKKLRDWHERRALEIKYLNSGNKKQYDAYKEADAQGKKAMLATMRDTFYAKHRYTEADHERSDSSADIERINDNLRAAGRKLRSAERNIGEAVRADATNGRRKLADRRDRAVVAAAIQRLAIDQGPSADDRRIERQADNVAAQLERDERENILQLRNDDADRYKIIKRELDAKQLLALLSHTHGVVPEKYAVTKGKDGSDRIRAGDRNLNVADFLTKELHLSWAEAAPILREAYERQQLDAMPDVSSEPLDVFWKDFKQWDRERLDDLQHRWEEQKASEPVRRRELRDEYRRQKEQLDQQRASSNPTERGSARADISILKMAQVQKEMALRALIAEERASLRAERAIEITERYKIFLAQQAEEGRQQALAELRKMQHNIQSKHHALNDEIARLYVIRRSAGHNEDAIHDDAQLTWKVQSNGAVRYYRDDVQILVDQGRFVSVTQEDDATMETGLRFAVAKWGRDGLVVTGSESFRRRAAEIAAEKYINVRFKDESMNQIMAERKAQMARERINLYRALGLNRTGKTSPVNIKEQRMSTVEEQEAIKKQDRDRDEAAKKEAARREQMQKDAAQKQGAQAQGVAQQQPEAIEAKRANEREVARQARAERDAQELKRKETEKQRQAQKSGSQGQSSGFGPSLGKIEVEDKTRPEYMQPSAGNSPNATGQEREYVFLSLHDKHGISNETIAEAEKEGFLKAENNGPNTFPSQAFPHQVGEASILQGDPNNVHVVKYGEEALALRDIAKREGSEPPTVIVGNGNLQNTTEAAALLKNADNVTVHDTAQLEDVQATRGKPEGISEVQLPQGVDSVEDLNIIQRHEQEDRQAAEPTIIQGDPKNVHVVRSNEDAKALQEIVGREGYEQPTTIVTGEDFKGNLADSEQARDVLKNADSVVLHDASREQDAVNARGTNQGVAKMKMPEGVESLQELNEQHKEGVEAERTAEQQRAQESAQRQSRSHTM